MPPVKFQGEITVASRIVDQLSSGLYESPAACLKELINNSYDADADKVEVFIKPDADRIIIDDNGCGMTRTEFETHFKKISESHKRADSDETARGRKKIGKIGIGFIAANEICETMEIYSTTAGSTQLLHVEIHFDIMRQDPAVRRREGDELAKGDYTGEVLEAEKRDSFTQVILNRVRPNAKQLFAGESNRRREIKAGEGEPAQLPKTLYGLTAESVRDILSEPTLHSWSELDTYSENMLRVALNVPVRYYKGWIPANLHRSVTEFERSVEQLDFRVFYDGTELRKPIVLRPPPEKEALVSRFQFAGEHVAAEGYFYVQHGVVRPRDLHGLLVRIRQAAVGGYDPSFLDFPPSEGSIIQRWISAEIWADDRLEDALNIDRKTLRLAHPAYIELQEAVHAHLAKVISRAREELYDAGSDQRKQQKAEAAVEELRQFARTRMQPVDATAARDLVAAWTRPARGPSGGDKALLKKFTVVQLYELVLEVAQEILTPAQVRQFVKRLTERISK